LYHKLIGAESGAKYVAEHKTVGCFGRGTDSLKGNDQEVARTYSGDIFFPDELTTVDLSK